MSADAPTAPGQVPEMQGASLVGEVLDGRYRITRKLGEGGMGEVYAAEHVHIEKKFAIKLLRQEIVSNPEAVTRFRQEARSSSSIGHRNIIAIEDFGQLVDGRIYMCMELLNGAALNDMITQPMPMDRLLNILIQTGHGLAAAHAKGIVHRDMKPENIFVTIGPNGEDIPKLLDFGIAKVAGNDGQNHLTRTGTIFGTPFYMAPEQALGNAVDARTDIYAVGVIMYECFAGSLPFQGDSFMGILTQHITMEPEPVAQRAAKAGRHMPPGLAELITRCMQKNPAQRIGSMDELVNALIQIYRGMVGPGMSTYMEAFPVAASSAHIVQPTPPPMTGPVMTPGMSTSIPVNQHGSGPVPVIGGMPVGPSAGYSNTGPVPLAKKGSAGLVFAILAILLVGGGIAVFMVVHKGGGGGSGGSGSGQGTGSQQVIAGTPQDAAQGMGTVAMPDAPPIAPPIDAAAPPPADAPEPPPPADAGNAVPTNAVKVLVVVRNTDVDTFELFENGAKVIDGAGGSAELALAKGEKHAYVLKARGYKDQKLAVDANRSRVTVSLSRVPQPQPQPQPDPYHGHNNPLPPPPGVNCNATIMDPHNKACVRQYCASHSDDVSHCGLE
ncbi:MAG TPA: serine/threonine-protein kinase [Kofleriaceae bacterium]